MTLLKVCDKQNVWAQVQTQVLDISNSRQAILQGGHSWDLWPGFNRCEDVLRCLVLGTLCRRVLRKNKSALLVRLVICRAMAGSLAEVGCL